MSADYHSDSMDTTRRPYRIYTIFRNLTIAVVLWLLLACVCMSVNHPIAFFAFIAIAALPVLAIVLALIFPVRRSSPVSGTRQSIFGCLGCLGVTVLSLIFVLQAFSYADAWTRGEVNAEFKTIDDLAGARLPGTYLFDVRIASTYPLEELIPEEARSIHFEGRGGGLIPNGDFADFSCAVTEADFIRFAKSCSYIHDLATNRFVNANEKTNPDKAATTWADSPWHERPEPRHYLSYTFIYTNNGGIQLVFDPETGILRGDYSSN